MLPVLLLDIQPTDIVLDLCASPGSKSGQCIETINQIDNSKSNRGNFEGGLVSNELDKKRSFILAHQLNRLQSSSFLVINSNAIDLESNIKFDKIICDVPCSGDGAIRKLPERAKNWSPLDAIDLHPTQQKILINALNLVKEGGLVIYSTCSLNTVENEAVVASVMSKFRKSVELIDVHKLLPNLKMNSGLNKW